ncbi:hypothetical protein IWW36_001852 [Coemansia brasiliensis]|uniref:DUF605-domain-containing protein n=1 Tax=Coemansia brasiliensis TaxID=2650707 RepID=A0A9W8IGZ9_9FUNG|nr:hypothetical protein IWW36_001852 [Coemansia brasiliensis]
MVDLKAPPDELKHVLPYVQRGLEVAKADPIVAYFCKYYAAQLSIPHQGASAAAQEYLTKLLDELESEKAQLTANDNMKNDQVASQHCTSFALRIFAKADTEDREGRANKATARNFIVSSQFMQVLNGFGSLPEDISEKIKYAKWRAAEILKAMREGRQPELPPGEQAAAEEKSALSESSGQNPTTSPSLGMSQSSQLQAGSAGPASTRDIMSWPSPPPPTTHSEPAWTAAPSSAEYHYSSMQPSQATHSAQQLDTLPNVPHEQPQATSHIVRSIDVSPGAATFIPVPASRLPQVPSVTEQGSENGVMLNPADAKSAQKHARWAISALEYDDVETAVQNLQKAIEVLQPYRKL